MTSTIRANLAAINRQLAALDRLQPLTWARAWERLPAPVLVCLGTLAGDWRMLQSRYSDDEAYARFLTMHPMYDTIAEQMALAVHFQYEPTLADLQEAILRAGLYRLVDALPPVERRIDPVADAAALMFTTGARSYFEAHEARAVRQLWRQHGTTDPDTLAVLGFDADVRALLAAPS